MKHAVLLLAVAAVLGAASPGAQDKGTVYRAGEHGVTHPVVIKEVKPRYPQDALKAKKNAIVVVDCVVTTEGLPSEIRVEKPGDEAFEFVRDRFNYPRSRTC